MFYNAKYATLSVNGGEMEYIRFGTGKRCLVMLPGLGTSLRSMKGTALPMALMYRMFAREFTVYVFGRRSSLPSGSTIRDMAVDQAEAMEQLGIDRADVIGVSMGGMIAQWLAIDYPGKVDHLILTVTASRPNPILTESVEEWISLAKAGNHGVFMESNLRRIYSEGYYRRNRWMVPILGLLTKPDSYEPFYIQVEACLTHNAYDDLSRICAGTLVIGGEKDQSLGGDASREIAGMIPGADLRMYPQWGHGLYEEAGDFNQVVYQFLTDPY